MSSILLLLSLLSFQLMALILETKYMGNMPKGKFRDRVEMYAFILSLFGVVFALLSRYYGEDNKVIFIAIVSSLFLQYSLAVLFPFFIKSRRKLKALEELLAFGYSPVTIEEAREIDKLKFIGKVNESVLFAFFVAFLLILIM